MEQVKQRLSASFLEPLRNPVIAARFGKSLRGGLLLWGPPGCGKTFIARALAGELGASFLVVGLNDVLEMWVGKSEQNLHEVFEEARRSRPCVLFFDELDAIGQRRANLRSASATFRNVVNLFLAELDGADADNDGVFVLGATNHHPRGRPVEPFDVRRIAQRTDGFSGADLALVCDQATEQAMSDSIRQGSVRPISQADIIDAVRTVQPSIGPWVETARNFATYSNDTGMYDELVDYLKGGSTGRWKRGGR